MLALQTQGPSTWQRVCWKVTVKAVIVPAGQGSARGDLDWTCRCGFLACGRCGSQLVTCLKKGACAGQMCSLHEQAVGAAVAAAAWGALPCLGLLGWTHAIVLAKADICATQAGASLLAQGEVVSFPRCILRRNKCKSMPATCCCADGRLPSAAPGIAPGKVTGADHQSSASQSCELKLIPCALSSVKAATAGTALPSHSQSCTC